MKNQTLIKFITFVTMIGFNLFGGTWQVLRSFPAPTGATNGMAWDGTHLWHSNEWEPMLYRLDPISGKVVSSIETDVPDQGDIAFHNGQLWVVSENEHMLYQVDPRTGETIQRITFDVSVSPDPGLTPNSQMEGLTSDGTSLWLDFLGAEVYRVDPISGERALRYRRNFGGYADGLAWGWGSMFMSTNSTEILEIEACTGIIIEVFKAPAGIGGGPEGMTFDGEYIWYADNTTDHIYQIQLLDDYLVKRTARAAVGGGNCQGDELAVGTISTPKKQKNVKMQTWETGGFIWHNTTIYRLDGSLILPRR